MRQLFENNRKIRRISLLKYSNISLTKIDTVLNSKTTIHDVSSKAELLHAEVPFNILPTENDSAIIYYANGYCCRSLVKTNKCEARKEAMIVSIVETDIENKAISKNALDFIQEISRGRLWKPIAKRFYLGCLCWILLLNYVGVI